MQRKIATKAPAIIWFITGMITYSVASRFLFTNIEDNVLRILASAGFIIVITIVCTLIDNYMDSKTKRS